MRQDDDNRFAKTNYMWLKSEENLTENQRSLLDEVFNSQLETGKA
ncbi:MAG: transposase [Planctomycetaceae bacterium]|nr:transposase [Planctomycetales bacterium]MCB9940663.1 transposase [Planctomycetaceae bacterium]